MVQSGPYPNKPVKVLVPFNAGAATDIVVRAILEHMSWQMGQPFIIDNKPGESPRVLRRLQMLRSWGYEKEIASSFIHLLTSPN